MKTDSVFMHFRKKYGYKKEFTLAVTTDRTDGHIGISFAFVNDKDQFCKKIGRSIALGRAKTYLSEKAIILPVKVLDNYKGTVEFMRKLITIAEEKNLHDKEKTSEIYQIFDDICSGAQVLLD